MQLLDALREDFWQVKDLLATSQGRRVLTEHDPLLFAYLYFPHHVTNPVDNSQTVCDFHLDLLEYAESWAKPLGKAKESRACFIAPRQSGKSTWIFLLLPMWAAAHGHRKFVAAFSDSESQAMTHLHTFKMELQNNERLRSDYPELCAPMKVGGTAKELLYNRNQIMQSNGFVFMAKGADSAALGMKLGAQRPDVLLFDDIEPGESNYSAYEAGKRKETLISDLFALNAFAVVAIVGTTTMPNSLIDQMRKVGEAKKEFDPSEYDDGIDFVDVLDPEFKWVEEQNIKVHYWPVILNEGENERSLWPEVWPMDELNKDRHTNAFKKNMMNRPVAQGVGVWNEEDIDIDSLPNDHYRRTIIAVDPAVTTKKSSDYTGIAVVSQGMDGNVYVRYADQMKGSGTEIADKVRSLIEDEEFAITHLVVETNQGGDLWKQVFTDLPVKYKPIRSQAKKEVRAEMAADYYKKGQVKHTRHFHVAEEQMLAFPRVTHDDVVDAIVTGVLALKKARQGVSVTQTNWRFN